MKPQTAVGASGAAVTLTISSASTRVRVWSIVIVMYNVAARTGVGTPVTVTSTNIGGLAWTFPSAGAIGTITEEKTDPACRLDSDATGNVTIVCPATTNVIWRITVAFETTIA